MINQSKDNTQFSMRRVVENITDTKSHEARSSNSKINSKKKIEMFYVTETFYKKQLEDDF